MRTQDWSGNLECLEPSESGCCGTENKPIQMCQPIELDLNFQAKAAGVQLIILIGVGTSPQGDSVRITKWTADFHFPHSGGLGRLGQ